MKSPLASGCVFKSSVRTIRVIFSSVKTKDAPFITSRDFTVAEDDILRPATREGSCRTLSRSTCMYSDAETGYGWRTLEGMIRATNNIRTAIPLTSSCRTSGNVSVLQDLAQRGFKAFQVVDGNPTLRGDTDSKQTTLFGQHRTDDILE